MKHLQLIIILVIVMLFGQSTIVNSQTLSPRVSPVNGGYAEGGGSLSWTMGETFTKTLISESKMLTQGEQQPYIFLKLINLKIFIEGYYTGSGQMQPLLFTSELSPDPTACDSITVELHDSTSPFATVTTAKALLRINGSAEVVFPTSVLNNSYYIAVLHRNAMETWSKNPVRFNDAVESFDFTSP
jgi:hypothetical protein